MKHERKQTIMDEQFYDSNNSYETPSQEIPVYTPPTPKKREKKNRMGLRICALALVFALLGGALGAGGVIWYESSRGQTGTVSKNETAMLQGIREKSVLNTVTVDSGKEMTAAEVYAANVNSTVGITTSITTNYWGFQTTSAAAGSDCICGSTDKSCCSFAVSGSPGISANGSFSGVVCRVGAHSSRISTERKPQSCKV